MQTESDIQWDHSHDFGEDNQHRATKVWAVFWLTTVVMVLEIAAGYWSGSMALLADGWHMGTHSAAFAIAIFAYWYAKKHSNNRAFSFGTGKVTYLGGFASAIALAIVALVMISESIVRLIEPHTILFNEAIIVAFIGLSVNVASVYLLRDDHHHHSHDHDPDHHHHHDQNLKAAYFHVLADTLTSLLAILALFTGKYFGWIWMDALMGIVGAAVILRWSYGLIRDTSSVLLDKSVDMTSFDKIADAVNKQHGATINDLHIWKIASNHQAAILSVTSDTSLNPEDYRLILKQHNPGLTHISIEINPLR